MLINRRILDFTPPCFGLDLAIGLDGVNDYFEQGQVTADFNFAAGEDVYIETIFKTNNQSIRQSIIATQDRNNTQLLADIGFSILFFPSGLNTTRILQCTFIPSNGQAVAIRTPENTITENTYYHVALSRTSGVWQWYIDGTAVTTTVINPSFANGSISNSASTGTRGLQIGTRRFGSFEEKWNGVISKVIIGNTVPSNPEILRRANEPCCIKKDEYENVSGAWFFQEASGNLIDFSSSSIDLTPVSSPDYQQQGPCL